MDDTTWNSALTTLGAAADRIEILSRCVGVLPQLAEWRATGAEIAGGDAANALDQARGDLEWLASEEGAELLAAITSLLEILPPAWD
jgi:hypothetical protein